MLTKDSSSLGDLKYKPLGVTPEPQVKTLILDGTLVIRRFSHKYSSNQSLGPKHSHVTLVSDGVTSCVSDEEISDLARGAHTPKDAAQKILSYAEEMGSQDNLTALVIPLAGWGKIQGDDRTKELREYRREQMIGTERQRRM